MPNCKVCEEGLSAGVVLHSDCFNNLIKENEKLATKNTDINLRFEKAIELLKLTAKGLKNITDETGNCYGCYYFDRVTEKCSYQFRGNVCDTKNNNMWKWEYQNELDKLIGDKNE